MTFVRHPPLMMAQSWTESTWEITNYGRFINQFLSNIIRSIRQFERLKKRYVDKKISIVSNIYIYIYIYIVTIIEGNGVAHSREILGLDKVFTLCSNCSSYNLNRGVNWAL